MLPHFIVTCRNGRPKHGGVFLCQPEYCGLRKYQRS